jgi:hypothetical protein
MRQDSPPGGAMNKIIRSRAARRALAAATALLAGGWLAAGSAIPASASGSASSAAATPAAVTAAAVAPSTTGGAFGPNVFIFNPGMSQASIQSTLDAIDAQQVSNQFGTQRYAVLFEPGTYGTADDPLDFQVGYYTTVAGLGLNPADVVINGAINSVNQCDSTGSCTALENFWRSLSNLTINVTTTSTSGCFSNAEFWGVSQASPFRRVHVNGQMNLFDYCSNPNYSSGGFIADSEFTGSTVINGSQQQYITRNSDLDGWTNSVWNQVFCGDNGAPATDFVMGGNQYTTLASCPVTEEEPFLYTDSRGNYNVFVPAVQHNSSGPSWTSGSTAGTAIPISKFFVATPSTSVLAINVALALGKDLILTPGVYNLSLPILVSRPDTVVLGLGMATLVPQNGNAAMVVVPNKGVKLAGGIIVDAGPKNSPVLVSVGTPGASNADDPDTIQDVFFRIGGAATTPVSATVSLLDNAGNSIIDDVWAWRADHGNDVGWTLNKADTGVAVTGNNVTAYGLFTEHYQKNEVIWSGQGGTDIFFQNELPYDPPSQSAWMASPTQDGYPAFRVTSNVKSFQGYGMGSYVVFISTSATLFNAEAFQAPKTPGVQFHDILGVWIAGSGGDNSIINGVGGPVTSTNPGKVEPVDLTTYP